MDDSEGLSRFVDLSNPEAPGFPDDLARFGQPVAPAPAPSLYVGPKGEAVALPCFEIGLVMAGAVSAGAYTAGVLDYLIEVLDDWEVAKERDAREFGADFARWRVPPHAVRIAVVAGASAGSVCSALVAVAAQRRFLPVRGEASNLAGPNAARDDNPFYALWVNRLDIAGMLDTSDLAPDATLASIRSLLNSAPVAGAAAAALTGHGPPPTGRQFPERRRYLADPLPVALSVANLDGIPFCYRFEGLEGARFATVRHADAMRFLVHDRATPAPEATAPGGFITVTGPPTSDPAQNPDAGGWVALANAALASGAFPVAFAPILLGKAADDYRFDLRLRGDMGVGDPAAWEQPSAVSGGFSTVAGALPGRFASVDGGTMNNQPFQFARSVLTGPLGQLDGNGATAAKAMVIIDPFPADQPEAANAGRTEPPAVLAAFTGLLRAWVNQARYDANDLALAADAELYSRFMLSPMRARAARDGVPGDTALGQAAIASGAMGGFSGFLSRRFRHHDFLLGRRNAENFLRNYLALPEGNPLFHAGWWAVRDAADQAQERTLTSEGGTAKAGERLIIPTLSAIGRIRVAHDDPDRHHADETQRKLFVRRHLTEPLPIWPGAGRPFRAETLAGAIGGRVDALLKIAAAPLAKGFFARQVAKVVRARAREQAVERAVKGLDAALKAHRLDDPYG